MSSDFTEHQSDDELRKARQLSVEPTRPPSKIEGYTIQTFIGRGSYGEVWSAIDQKTGKKVAIKFYAQRSSADVKQLAQEVEKLVVLVADRHVVQLLDVGWDASPPYYVMDYIEYGSLEDHIKSGDAMPVSRAVQIFEDVATGLMHLHGKGILHCDLKPGNVLLDQDGKPRLADFGQSRLSTDNTAALGTLFYMAPEQADLRAVPDAKWDVYGLGALLYTMLTGKPPYYSDELKAKIESSGSLHERLKVYRRSLNDAPPLKDLKTIPGVDRSLADIIYRCIETKPANRLASAQSVLTALQQRDIKNENRPLMLLGILGPILLLIVMSLFGWFAFRQITGDAEEAIVAKAFESNEFAAQLAARSASEQLDEFFRVVRQTSRDADFKEALQQVLDDKELASMRDQLSDPHDNSNEDLDGVRKDLRNHSLRKERLQPIMQHLLDDPNDEYPESASWFVTDRAGNQIAGAFIGGGESTIGKNYSFRTYFTGEPEDLRNKTDSGEYEYSVDKAPVSRQVVQKPHLSAKFFSEASGLIKVAFSTPVRNEDQEIIGIVAVTADVGKMVVFKNHDDQYVMLVDDRKSKPDAPGGIVLEHPLFGIAKANAQGPKKGIPQELTNVTIDISTIAKDKITVINDPLGKTSFGEQFTHRYIVAKEEVVKENRDAKFANPEAESEITGSSGLYVLAFENYDSVLEPSRRLSGRLGRLAVLAFLILLSVAIGMWLLVNRMFRESRRRLTAPPEGSTVGTFGGSALQTNSATGSTTRGSEN